MNNLKNFTQFIGEEEGMGTVEIILIIVVLVGLVGTDCQHSKQSF